MKVHEIMTRDAQCVRPDTNLSQAAIRMRELNVGALPVCGDNAKLVGMITDRDIVIRAVADGANPNATLVESVMSPDICYCFADDDVKEAARIMESEQIRRLVVLDQDKQLIGILSLGDLAVRCHDDKLSGEALEQISEPANVH
jgi:CBS domain-containing protein